MGDFRAEIKIKMQLMGKQYNHTFNWINYSPDEDGVDYRVKQFFAEAWDDTQTRHDKIMQKAWAEENKEQIEQEEKKILEELKKKYESY
jgi:hypothetical protein